MLFMVAAMAAEMERDLIPERTSTAWAPPSPTAAAAAALRSGRRAGMAASATPLGSS